MMRSPLAAVLAEVLTPGAFDHWLRARGATPGRYTPAVWLLLYLDKEVATRPVAEGQIRSIRFLHATPTATLGAHAHFDWQGGGRTVPLPAWADRLLKSVGRGVPADVVRARLAHMSWAESAYAEGEEP